MTKFIIFKLLFNALLKAAVLLNRPLSCCWTQVIRHSSFIWNTYRLETQQVGNISLTCFQIKTKAERDKWKKNLEFVVFVYQRTCSCSASGHSLCALRRTDPDSPQAHTAFAFTHSQVFHLTLPCVTCWKQWPLLGERHTFLSSFPDFQAYAGMVWHRGNVRIIGGCFLQSNAPWKGKPDECRKPGHSFWTNSDESAGAGRDGCTERHPLSETCGGDAYKKWRHFILNILGVL